MKKKYLSSIAILCACLVTACGTNNNRTNSEKNTDTQRTSTVENDTDSENNAENGTDSKNDTDTENSTSDTTAESSTQGICTLQSSQTDNTAEDYYNVCTSFSAQKVESFASNIKAQILVKDWNGFAENLSYPITIDGNTCANSADFLALDIDSKISQDFLDAIEAETCQQMFCNYEGISMGAGGQIWIGEISGSSELKVTAINGMFE